MPPAPRAASSTSRATSAAGGPATVAASSSRLARVVIPAKTASAASRWPATSYGGALGRAAGLVAGQRPPARPVDVQGVVHQPRRQRLHQSGEQGPGRLRLVAVGEQHQLVDPVLPGQVAELAGELGRRGRRPAGPSGRPARPGRQRRKTDTSDSAGWKPSWNGIRASRSAGAAGPQPDAVVGSQLDRPTQAAAHPPRSTQPAAHRITARSRGHAQGQQGRTHVGRMRIRPGGVPAPPRSVDSATSSSSLWKTLVTAPVRSTRCATVVGAWLSRRTSFRAWDRCPAARRFCPGRRPPSRLRQPRPADLSSQPGPPARAGRAGRPSSRSWPSPRRRGGRRRQPGRLLGRHPCRRPSRGPHARPRV